MVTQMDSTSSQRSLDVTSNCNEPAKLFRSTCWQQIGGVGEGSPKISGRSLVCALPVSLQGQPSRGRLSTTSHCMAHADIINQAHNPPSLNVESSLQHSRQLPLMRATQGLNSTPCRSRNSVCFVSLLYPQCSALCLRHSSGSVSLS